MDLDQQVINMFGNQEHTLWVEKFRPGTLDGYVGNEHIIDKVKIYIESGDVPMIGILYFSSDLDNFKGVCPPY